MVRNTYTCFDNEIYDRANECIAHGALTNSKRPECLVKGIYPTHVRGGRGCVLFDAKGNKYIDFICGLGSNLLGYANTHIEQVIINRIGLGITLSLSTYLEVECAEKVKVIFPFIERLRFLKTGSDACTAAIRIARTYTGKKFILSEAYHGWHDEFASLTPPALGIVEHNYIRALPQDLSLIPSETAAIIIEPVVTDNSDARIARLRELRDYCTAHNIVLIFDEVITGFRYPKMSVCNFYNITPDLICMGKAIGGGLPLAIVGGSKKIMECDQYFVSSTFAGETLSLAAAIKTMELLVTKKYDIDNLWAKGAEFITKFNSLWPNKIWIEGYPSRGVFKCTDDLVKAIFWQECVKAGILFGPSWFFNFAHIDVMDSVLNICNDVLNQIKMGNKQLDGEMPTTPFAQKLRETK